MKKSNPNITNQAEQQQNDRDYGTKQTFDRKK